MSIASEIQRIISGKTDIKQYVFNEFGIVIPDSVTLDKYKYYIENSDYLSFYCDEAGTIGWKCSRAGLEKTIQYSKDFGQTWTEITSSTEVTTISVSAGDIVWFKGANTQYGISTSKYNCFTLSNKAHVYGNVNSLTGDNSSVSRGCFACLFKGCTNLYTYETKKIILPATTIGNTCYSGMFSGCTSLTAAPELPSTTAPDSCYDSMFIGCINLKTTPELRATTVGNGSYAHMFYNCESITMATELPATTVGQEAYCEMFYGCTNLVESPELPATTLGMYCYSRMFSGCTNLKKGPSELPATTTTQNCYSEMFYGCTNLENTPSVLPATTAEQSSYRQMFYECANITKAPDISATTLNYGCCYEMFFGCTNLKTIPSILPATTLAQYCYSRMFRNCVNITTAPVLPATTLVTGCYAGMFRGCSSLNYIKALFTTTPSIDYTEGWVSGVSETGTFVKAYDATWDVTGTNGVPTGWTVKRAAPEPLHGEFSVSATKKVRFAPGNLQAVVGGQLIDTYNYVASEWKFAGHQYDYIGYAPGNTSFAVGTTVDLFCWVGASASYDSYGLCTNGSSNNAYYGTSDSDALKTDWGSIPGIETWIGSVWRTLTTTEWNYLFTQRTNASSLYGQCQITGSSGTMRGMLILPDNWTKPSNCTVTTGSGAYTRVTYSATAETGTSNAWCDMEAAGAVFLPAAGYRYSNVSVESPGNDGYYWSSSVNNASRSYIAQFWSSSLYPQSFNPRHYGSSVRLVKDVN